MMKLGTITDANEQNVVFIYFKAFKEENDVGNTTFTKERFSLFFMSEQEKNLFILDG